MNIMVDDIDKMEITAIYDLTKKIILKNDKANEADLEIKKILIECDTDKLRICAEEYRAQFLSINGIIMNLKSLLDNMGYPTSNNKSDFNTYNKMFVELTESCLVFTLIIEYINDEIKKRNIDNTTQLSEIDFVVKLFEKIKKLCEENDENEYNKEYDKNKVLFEDILNIRIKCNEKINKIFIVKINEYEEMLKSQNIDKFALLILLEKLKKMIV